MYECPNCTGHLKYNIETQRLYCISCGSDFSPYDLPERESDLLENDQYETTVYMCPHCGGEIISEDTTVATFCSYCGATTVLEGHIQKKNRPEFIIPFKIGKSECKTIFQERVKNATYAPDNLKNPEQIEKIRGIYMPYGDYTVYKKDHIRFKGENDNNLLIVKYHNVYELECDLREDFQGLMYDLAISFPDDLNKLMFPYDIRGRKLFNPSYLCGFYADGADVDQEVYDEDAKKLVGNMAYREAVHSEIYKKYKIDEATTIKKFMPEEVSSKVGLLPVWFLSIRDKDKLYYGVVNGQTGKIALDLPMDMKKIMKRTVWMGLIIFCLLFIFNIFKPLNLINFTLILSLFVFTMYEFVRFRCEEKIENRYDKGLQSMKYGNKTIYDSRMDEWMESITTRSGKIRSILFIILASIVALILLMQPIESKFGVPLLATAIAITPISKLFTTTREDKKLRLFSYVFMLLLAWLNQITCNRFIIYGGLIIGLVILSMTLVQMVQLHNKTIERDLPYFKDRGGDNND